MLSKRIPLRVSARLKSRRTAGDTVIDILICLFFGIFAIICIYPFYYIFINSISANDLVERGRIVFLPQGIHFNNYAKVLELKGLGMAVVNSLLRTGLGTVVHVISTAFVGYAMSRQEFWHRKFWYRFMIITMYLSAGVVPVYLNMRMLGLLNNFMVYILPGAVSAYNMILIKTYMESIAVSLEESAVLDGAGYAVRFTRIILPLSKPILATVAVFKAVNEWNAYMDTILYMSSGKFQTLQSMLWRYLNQATELSKMLMNGGISDSAAASFELNPISVRHTLTFITVLPILCVYPYFQRFFVKGIMFGAVKG